MPLHLSPSSLHTVPSQHAWPTPPHWHVAPLQLRFAPHWLPDAQHGWERPPHSSQRMPALQVEPVPQGTVPGQQAWPVAPQASHSLTELQVFPAAQDTAPEQQKSPTAPQAPQWPSWHVWAPSQAVPVAQQGSPRPPQWHKSPTQTPVGQLVPVSGSCPHVPFARHLSAVHPFPSSQDTHIAPAIPHALESAPDRHVVPSQQPRQHVPPRHTPPAQSQLGSPESVELSTPDPFDPGIVVKSVPDSTPPSSPPKLMAPSAAEPFGRTRAAPVVPSGRPDSSVDPAAAPSRSASVSATDESRPSPEPTCWSSLEHEASIHAAIANEIGNRARRRNKKGQAKALMVSTRPLSEKVDDCPYHDRRWAQRFD